MLRIFLRARINARRFAHRERLHEATRAVSKVVRRDAGVTARQFDAALAGRADAETRQKVWHALGVEATDA